MVRVTVAVASIALLLAAGAVARPNEDARRSAARVPPAPAPVFAVSGRGWGHGVGMSQYGALGFARAGWTYDAILAHYYPGTELGAAPVSRVRVLLAEGRKTVRVSSAAPFRLRDGDGGTYELPAGTYAFGPGFRVEVGAEPAKPLRGPLLFSPGGAPLALDGARYRGALEATAVSGRVRVVNSVPLEAYLAGVVPREVPSGWPAEALKAQAVVARSYALASRKTGGPFDMYADVRSQVYGGVAAETAATTSAVGETAGQVLLHEGVVATTFFYSTSGGRTANVEDVWDGDPIPYLRAVDDPYDSISPHHRWGPVPFTAAALARRLGLRGRLVDVATTTNASGRVDELVATTTAGETRLPAGAVRTKLGLRSTWFDVGVLSLAAPPRPRATFGARLRVTGVARGVPAPAVEQRLPGTAWQKAAAVAAGPDGSFSLALRAAATAEYRLAAGPLRTAPVKVVVAAAVKLEPPATPGALRGVALPALEGTTVAVQRREGAGWRTLATVPVGEKGRFEAAVELVPGTYRARYAPGRGYAAGISPVLSVVAP